MNSIEGYVVSSSVKEPAHPNLLTTKIKVMLNEGQEIPYVHFEGLGPHEISVRGRHILGGRQIRCDYKNYSGTLWAERYDLLDDHGNIVHSDSALG